MANAVNNLISEIVINMHIFMTEYHYITIYVIVMASINNIKKIYRGVKKSPSCRSLYVNLLAVGLYIIVPQFAYMMLIFALLNIDIIQEVKKISKT